MSKKIRRASLSGKASTMATVGVEMIANQTGRPPTEGTRLTNPQHVRCHPDDLRVAQQIANQKFGGNVSRALRFMLKLGRLAWQAQRE